jgi:heptosyltransferase-3
VRAGGLGDLLLLRRAIAGLKHAGHGVSLLAPAAGRALLGPGTSAVDEVLDWDDPAFVSLFAPGDAPQSEAAARLKAFSACIAYTGQVHFVAGIERLIPKVVGHPPSPVGVHAAKWLAQPARALGVEPPALPPSLEASASEEAEAALLLDRLPRGFVAIHPGSGAPAKNWPSDRFAKLVKEIGEETFLLVEGPADAASVTGIAEAGPCVRARFLSSRTLGAVLRHAGLFVGNDSGVTHLAAAWGAPSLALFGPTDPAIWAPVGRLVAVSRSSTASMDDLSLAQVLRDAQATRVGAEGGLGAKALR